MANGCKPKYKYSSCIQLTNIECSIYALLFDRTTQLKLEVDLISKVPDLLLKLVVDTNLVDLVGEKEISINGAHSNHPKEKSDYSRNYTNGYAAVRIYWKWSTLKYCRTLENILYILFFIVRPDYKD